MKLSPVAYLGILFILLSSVHIHAQQFTDSSQYNQQANVLRQIYLNEIGDNAQIYHGAEYIRNGQKALGFPFFESNDLLDGAVYYQGTLYPQRKIYYDLVADEVVTGNYANDAQISLSMDKADSFKIGNHFFVRLNPANSPGLPKEGYYERLYAGEPGLYVKHEKRLVTGSGNEEIKYIQYNNYFVKKNTVFYAVDGKSGLLNEFSDKKDELKKYIRSNKLNFKKDLENSMVLTTSYYSQLKH
jgi:hypothetical protein